MELSDEAVFCRARGVYPAPTLLWSTDPPIDVEPFNNTKKQQTDLGFYDIESWLTLKVARSINVDFICDITNDRNNKRAQLRIQDAIHAASNSEMKVPCSFPAKLDTFELTWRTRHSEHILSMGVSGLKRQLTISAEWKHHVLDGRSAWRHLKLPNVLPDHQGTYTCQVRTPQVTYITQTDVIVTSGSHNSCVWKHSLSTDYMLL
ncbi:uncharacterized protein LOC133493037 [Syngnathoides biaculeatus]|uniref:uncharacterized protein LOC133493037 n=1 Tax=Syngnathoides biaculeatus TaxID=300417 RepID=UPI002ADE7F6C|nr:uncharacterized protein LOC133493037 [Syngnathoides biaculeatus]